MQMYDISTKLMQMPFVLQSVFLQKNEGRIFPLRDLIFVAIAIQPHGIYHAPAHLPYSTFLCAPFSTSRLLLLYLHQATLHTAQAHIWF